MTMSSRSAKSFRARPRISSLEPCEYMLAGVEEVDAGIEGVLDQRAAVVLAERPYGVSAVGFAVGHSADGDRGNVEAGASELDVAHGCSYSSHRNGEFSATSPTVRRTLRLATAQYRNTGGVLAATRHEPTRADAQQNRGRILQAAHDAFAESDDASLNSIAKRAAVGAGTLYRHFPTREALILAVYRHDVQVLAGSVAEVLVECETLDAFRIWFDRLAPT